MHFQRIKRYLHTTIEHQGYITISFSYVYLKGLHLGMGPSSPVVIDVHLLSLQHEAQNCVNQSRKRKKKIIVEGEKDTLMNSLAGFRDKETVPGNITSQYI